MGIYVLVLVLLTATANKPSILFFNGEFNSLQGRNHIALVKNAPILFIFFLCFTCAWPAIVNKLFISRNLKCPMGNILRKISN